MRHAAAVRCLGHDSASHVYHCCVNPLSGDSIVYNTCGVGSNVTQNPAQDLTTWRPGALGYDLDEWGLEFGVVKWDFTNKGWILANQGSLTTCSDWTELGLSGCCRLTVGGLWMIRVGVGWAGERWIVWAGACLRVGSKPMLVYSSVFEEKLTHAPHTLQTPLCFCAVQLTEGIEPKLEL